MPASLLNSRNSCRHPRADGVAADVLRSGRAAAVAEEARDGLDRARQQLAADDVLVGIALHALSVPAVRQRVRFTLVDADAVEIRVLGCLIEKQRTTPDTYPLTLNALRLACNQATNRDPVVDYDEETIREALQRLWRKEWARLASGQGSRSVKYRQLVQETLGLADDEISVLCVLMLRGPQTPGELKQRTDRLHPFAGLAEVEETLARLIERELAVRLDRRPGQKEERYAQLLGGAFDDSGYVDAPRPVLARDPLEERVAALEAEVAALKAELGLARSSAVTHEEGEPEHEREDHGERARRCPSR